MIGLGELGGLLVILPVIVLGFVFWMWMLVDCVTRETNEGNERLMWVIILVFTNFIGAALYYFVRRPVRLAQAGR